jgi:hypothetical protein
VDSFCRFSSPAASPYEVRRLCGLVGRAIRGADPERIADFVIAASDHLYDDFFRTFEERALDGLSAACAARVHLPELGRCRLVAIVGRYHGVFEGTLTQALERVPFADVIAPIPVPALTLVPIVGAGPDEVTGAAEVLRLGIFLEEGERPDLAEETYRRALVQWPGDAVLYAGLASLYVEREERRSEELRALLRRASEADPENAAWHYLRAGRHFAAGRDEEGLAALRAGAACPRLSFHVLDRARRTAAYLESRGFGPIQARLLGARSVSTALFYELKLLADQTMRRSIEYGEESPEALDLVLAYPETLDRQLGTEACPAALQHLRWGILAIGLRRRAETCAHADPEGSRLRLERVADLADRIAAADRGEKMCGGADAWAVLCRRLGEQRFLRWIDEVLYEDEAAFFLRCAEAGGLDAILTED